MSRLQWVFLLLVCVLFAGYTGTIRQGRNLFARALHPYPPSLSLSENIVTLHQEVNITGPGHHPVSGTQKDWNCLGVVYEPDSNEQIIQKEACIVFFDDFNNRTKTSVGNKWVQEVGSFEIANQQLTLIKSGLMHERFAGVARINAILKNADYSVSARLVNAGVANNLGHFGIFGRGIFGKDHKHGSYPNIDFYGAFLSDHYVYLIKFFNDQEIALAPGVDIGTPRPNDVIKLEMQGSTIHLYYRELKTPKISVRDTRLTNAGYACVTSGIENDGSGHLWDDFTIVSPARQLEVEIVGDGNVTANLEPKILEASFSCGDGKQCRLYPEGTRVILKTKEKSHFIGWSGGCSGKKSCSVTMNTDRAVTALFKKADETAMDQIQVP